MDAIPADIRRKPEQKTLISRVKVYILGGVILLAIAGFAGYFGIFHEPAPSQSGTKYRQAPDFELKDASGKTHSLAEFKGKAVLLHFWAAWCPPCLGEIPVFADLANVFKGQPLELVTVSLDDSWDAEKKVFPPEKAPAGVTVLLDAKNEVSDRYGSYAFPETYLISPKGEIITKWVGPQEWKNENFLKLMQTLLAAGH